MKYKKLIKKVNGNSVEVFEPEQRKLSTEITIILFIIGILVIIYNLGVLHGINKERADKNCIGVEEMKAYNNTLKIAETICVDIQKQQMGEIKNGYNVSLKLAEEEAKKWKNVYNLKLKEIESSSSSSSTEEIINN